MLKELIIDNLALLKHIHVSFSSGMTCFTGETGAGKSIMLDAINLALGSKCSPGFINSQNDPLEITAVFTVEPNSSAMNWLIENDFLDNQAKQTLSNTQTLELSINRVITKKNGSLKSKQYINKIPATLNQLKNIGGSLIYIHGQHEHLSLLKESNQLKILDSYGSLNKLASEVANIYKSWAECKKELEENINLQTEYQAKKQLLEFQISELEAAEIKPDEWEEISNQHQWLANQQLYVEQLNQVHYILTEGDEHQQSVNQLLGQVSNILNNISADQPTLQNIAEYINQALIQTEEANDELKHFLSNLDTDPESLAKLDRRISQLYELARKYKTKPALLPELYNNLSDELSKLDSVESNVKILQKKISELEEIYNNKASDLSKQRTKTAKQLSQELTSLLQKLRMQEAEVSISLQAHKEKSPKLQGLENCIFLIKTNSGQNLQPLGQGTSGGELSRVALATQVATARVEGTPSLIFDEVDVGIGGGTAEIVGKLLHKMGTSTQVMCITHLAQVAAQADNHIKVSKTSDKKTTHTNIELLNQASRIQELARMIGGLTITNQTLAHAEDLLNQASKAV